MNYTIQLTQTRSEREPRGEIDSLGVCLLNITMHRGVCRPEKGDGHYTALRYHDF